MLEFRPKTLYLHCTYKRTVVEFEQKRHFLPKTINLYDTYHINGTVYGINNDSLFTSRSKARAQECEYGAAFGEGGRRHEGGDEGGGVGHGEGIGRLPARSDHHVDRCANA